MVKIAPIVTVRVPTQLRDGIGTRVLIKDRRAFITIVASGFSTAPLTAGGQSTRRIPSLGILSPGSPASAAAAPVAIAFAEALRAQGWVEGQNLLINRAYSEGRSERYPELAAELVRLKVDVILAAGGPASLRAARQATKLIPIVMVVSSRDPVGSGLIKSFARPGGNITGITTAPADFAGKQLELLKELVQVIPRVGVLWDGTVSPYSLSNEATTAAESLGTELLAFVVRDSGGFERAIADAAKAQVNAMLVAGSPMFGESRIEVANLLTKYRLPAVAVWRDQAEAGVLMTYGPSIVNQFRSAAIYVDKILKGANPGELPVEQPTKYEFLINLKTAKTLGLTIPQSLLLRADEVIR